MKTFRQYHPIVNLIYFMFVIFTAMFVMHPIILLISFICSAAALIADRRSGVFLRLLPLAAVTAIVNPLFNHRGTSILAYFPNGNPLTLESVLYGIAAAVLLMSVIWWFMLLHDVITSDKWMYLFGRIAPSISLLLSMALRFVPYMTARAKETARAQRGLYYGSEDKHICKKIRSGSAILSTVTTRAFDDAVTTADSMKSRGYGMQKRTSYSVFRMTVRDTVLCLWFMALGGYVWGGALIGGVRYSYFPSVQPFAPTTYTLTVFAAYALLCMTPVWLSLKEAMKWKYIHSKI